jgi:hypothetical protein
MHTTISDADLDFVATWLKRKDRKHNAKVLQIFGINPDEILLRGNVKRSLEKAVANSFGYHKGQRVIAKLQLKVGSSITYFGRKGVITEIVPFSEMTPWTSHVMVVKLEDNRNPQVIQGTSVGAIAVPQVTS